MTKNTTTVSSSTETGQTQDENPGTGKRRHRSLEPSDAALQRDFKISFTMNEKEYNAVNRYLDKYRITNRSRWFRETILIHVLQKLEEDHPTLFDENEMRR